MNITRNKSSDGNMLLVLLFGWLLILQRNAHYVLGGFIRKSEIGLHVCAVLDLKQNYRGRDQETADK